MVPTKNLFPLLVSFILCFCSCNSGNGNQDAGATTQAAATVLPQAYDLTLVKGQIIDSVICKDNGAVSYSLYLPGNYTVEKSYPCIYFFDAHARGSLPVSMYKDLAERYGFVLVGSNVSKNGTQWPVTNDGVKALMADTRARIHLDRQQLYTSGFSGGSRVASSVAIFDGGIAGVIGCAAGFPNVDQGVQNKFDYFGMVGDFDFNLTEMVKLDEGLDQNGFTHQLLTSDGIHGWAHAVDFETGLLWMQVCAMKEKRQAKNDTLIGALKKDIDRRIVAARHGGEWIKEQELLAGAVRIFSGLQDVSIYQKQLTELMNGGDYKNAIATREPLERQEMNGQQELGRQFTQQDKKWWAAKIAELNRNANNAKTKQESQMYQRLLNYLGLVGYMTVTHALAAGDLDHAATYLEVFRMADPKNPDYPYLKAVYFMQKGDKTKAIASLDEAAGAGYSELATLTTNAVFADIRDDAGFKDVVAKVWANNKAK